MSRHDDREFCAYDHGIYRTLLPAGNLSPHGPEPLQKASEKADCLERLACRQNPRPAKIVMRACRLHDNRRGQYKNDLQQCPGRENPVQQCHAMPPLVAYRRSSRAAQSRLLLGTETKNARWPKSNRAKNRQSPKIRRAAVRTLEPIRICYRPIRRCTFANRECSATPRDVAADTCDSQPG